MARYFKIFIFVLLALVRLSSPARAVTYDLNISGVVTAPSSTVGTSIDTLGLFGPANASLTGDTFSANFYYSIPGATYIVQNQAEITVQPVTYSLTVNNETVTPASLPSFGPITFSQIQASTSQGSPGGIEVNVISETAPPDTAGSFDSQILLTLISSSLYPNGTQPNLLSPFSYTRQPGDTQQYDGFDLGGWNSTSDFGLETVNFTVDSVSLSETPLPPALPMFGSALLALAGFGAWKLRRRPARK
jgi:hypothetical protein